MANFTGQPISASYSRLLQITISGFPTPGFMFYDDNANVLYIYNSTNGWQGFEPTI